MILDNTFTKGGNNITKKSLATAAINSKTQLSILNCQSEKHFKESDNLMTTDAFFFKKSDIYSLPII